MHDSLPKRPQQRKPLQQELPQLPQLSVFVMDVSQPFVALPSQLAHPVVHPPHTPPPQLW